MPARFLDVVVERRAGAQVEDRPATGAQQPRAEERGQCVAKDRTGGVRRHLDRADRLALAALVTTASPATRRLRTQFTSPNGDWT
jgi:hypothetical protein